MKHNNFFACASLLAAFLCGMMSSCVRDYGKFEDVNLEMDAEVGLGAPIATVNLKVKDFLGFAGDKISVGTMDFLDGRYVNVLLYRDTFPMPREFQNIDLTRFFSSSHDEFLLKNGKINGKTVSSPHAFPADADEASRSMHFPMRMKMNNINNGDSDDAVCRIDSALLTEAAFTSKLGRDNYPAFSESAIERIDVILGKQFTRKKGKTLHVPFPSYGFNQPIPIYIDEFSMNFMKTDLDPERDTKSDYDENIVDSVDYEVVFVFKPGYTLAFDDSNSFTFDFSVNFVGYEALWGFFKPGPEMRDRKELIIEDEWPDWHKIKELQLCAAEPRIDMVTKTEVAAPMIIVIDTLYVKRAGQEEHFAKWNDKINKIYYMDQEVVRVSDPVGTVATNYFIADYHTENGHLDHLLNVRPDILFYSYHLDVNHSEKNKAGSEYPQHRLSLNRDVEVTAKVTIPFIFNEGMNCAYTDTMSVKGLADAVNVDSIIANVNVIDTVREMAVQIVLDLENSIPLDIKLSYYFEDEAGQRVDISDLITNTNDTVIIPAPANINNQSQVLEPARKRIVIDADNEALTKLAKVSRLRYTAILCTDHQSFEPNADGEAPKSVIVYDKSSFKIKLGAIAYGDARFDFREALDKEENAEQK